MQSALASRHVAVLLMALMPLGQVAAQAQRSATTDPKGRQQEVGLSGRAAPAARPLSDAELAIALQVHVGHLPCELGQRVSITPEPSAPGHFRLELGKARYRLIPQETTTGAIRLEDKAAGIVWLQLSNKSMLLDHKQGRRLADDCRSAAQDLTAQAMAANPPASILEPASPAVRP